MITRRSFVVGAPAAVTALSTSGLTHVGEKSGFAMPETATAPERKKPLFRELMGLNGHTVMFKPALYRPVCNLVRDYHNLDWDIGDDTHYAPRFPMSRNQVDWKQLYGSWNAQGFEIDVCIQFGAITPDKWKNKSADAHDYGLAFARYFGPSGAQRLATSAEIGNEPGNYSDKDYRTIFENMAKGLRDSDPGLKIVTCAAVPGKSEPYAKSLSCIEGLESLYDIINIHTYAFAEQYPTWRRSYPEDPGIKFLTDVTNTIAWRNAHAPGKQIWITEFGWDASTKPPPKTGDFSRWMSSTETQQAQYLVRSFLEFSTMDVDRAYIYFFDDNDEPQLHGSSGLTRKFVPKPSYYAAAHLYHTLSEYRFARAVIREPGNVYAHEYQHGSNHAERILAIWSPTGSLREAAIKMPKPIGEIYRAERMRLKAGESNRAEWSDLGNGHIKVTVTESPTYLWIRDAR